MFIFIFMWCDLSLMCQRLWWCDVYYVCFQCFSWIFVLKYYCWICTSFLGKFFVLYGCTVYTVHRIQIQYIFSGAHLTKKKFANFRKNLAKFNLNKTKNWVGESHCIISINLDQSIIDKISYLLNIKLLNVKNVLVELFFFFKLSYK